MRGVADGLCYQAQMRCLLAFFLLWLTVSAASAQQFTLAENGASYRSLQAAVDAIGDGTGTVVIAPGRYRDCAVQKGGAIGYRAATPGGTVFEGGICEGKAALVLRGRSARVEGIIFEHMAVPDGNGAGIRLEQGDLAIDNSVFRASQEGLLTAADPAHAITITRSTFSGLGRCDGGNACAHSVYVGGYGSLTVRNCRFEAGTGGHYLKSRARRVAIVDNSFDDSHGHLTNYMIDLPAGATGQVSGNAMVQGVDKENHSAFVTVGAEGAEQPSDGLVIVGNDARFVPGLSRQSVFVADWTGAKLAIGANDLAPGILRYQKR
jgi:hypothetical protein